MRSNLKHLKKSIAIVVALFIAYKLYNSQKQKNDPNLQSKAISKKAGDLSNGKEEPKPTQILASSEVSQKPEASDLKQAQKSFSKLLAVGVIPIPAQNSENKLRFVIKPNPVGFHCAAGDLDIMQVMTTSPSNKVFTISVESMKKGGALAAQGYSLSEIRKRAGFAVELPSDDGAYGLYLCIDSDQKKICSTSPNLDPLTWGQTDRKTKEMAEGHNLYFQLLIVKDKVPYLIPGAKWGKQNLEKLTKDIGPWLGTEAKYLSIMNGKLEALMPLPAVVLGRDLMLPLKYQEGKCG